MNRARPILAALFASIGLAAATPAVSASAIDIVETVPLEGRILVDTGAEELGSAYASGVKLTTGEWPNASLEVPSEASRARWSLAVEQPPGREASLQLTVCRDACNVMEPNPEPLATNVDAERLEATVDVASLDAVGWVVRSGGEPVTNVSVDGEARFAAATDEPAEPRARSAEALSTDTGGLPSLGLLAGAAATLALAGRGLRRWLPSLAALYHRVDDEELLDHPTRERICEIVDEHPGVHFAELKRRTDAARGNLDHHLHRLVEAELLEERSFAGYRCFFRRGEVPEDVLAVADRLRCETARAVLAAVDHQPGVNTAEIEADLAVARSTVSYHLGRLVEAGLVEREPDGAGARLRPTELGRRALAILGRG